MRKIDRGTGLCVTQMQELLFAEDAEKREGVNFIKDPCQRRERIPAALKCRHWLNRKLEGRFVSIKLLFHRNPTSVAASVKMDLPFGFIVPQSEARYYVNKDEMRDRLFIFFATKPVCLLWRSEWVNQHRSANVTRKQRSVKETMSCLALARSIKGNMRDPRRHWFRFPPQSRVNSSNTFRPFSKYRLSLKWNWNLLGPLINRIIGERKGEDFLWLYS